MKNSLILFAFLIFSVNFYSQFGTIKDKDGFTNVRKEANSKSDIIYNLSESEVFVFQEDSNSEWTKVYIPKNKFEIYCSEGDSYLIGFIHKSRLLPITDLPKYKGNEISFQYNLQKFYAGNKVIEYHEKWISKINGRRYYGRDGDMPTTEIGGIDVTINNEKIEISSVLYEDLFECNNNFNIFKYKEDYFISQWNSDGAGGFEIIWVINKNGVKQRSVWMP